MKGQTIIEKQFVVLGLSCASCALSLSKGLSNLNGVKSAIVNYATETLYISFDSNECDFNDINYIAKSLGYKVLNSDLKHDELYKEKSKRQSNLKFRLFFIYI